MRIERLTTANFRDFEALTACGDDGKTCFCSFWHVKVGSMADYDAMKADGPDALRRIMYARVSAGFHVGALAYEGDERVAWISVGPLPEVYWCRARVAALGIDAAETTAGITCVTIAPAKRGRGVQRDLALALLAYGGDQGWRTVEAYPFDDALTRTEPKLAWAGYEGPYREAGYARVEPHWLSKPGAERWICRASTKGGTGGGDATSDDASDSSAENCPTVPPVEGSACGMPGLDCPAGGSLSCPLHAQCEPNGAWRITCPTHVFGSDVVTCSCPHPGG